MWSLCGVPIYLTAFTSTKLYCLVTGCKELLQKVFNGGALCPRVKLMNAYLMAGRYATPYNPSLHLNSRFPGGPELDGTRLSPFWILLELRLMEVVVTTGAIRWCKAPVKMSPPTNQHPVFLQARCPLVALRTVSKDWRKSHTLLSLFKLNGQNIHLMCKIPDVSSILSRTEWPVFLQDSGCWYHDNDATSPTISPDLSSCPTAGFQTPFGFHRLTEISCHRLCLCSGH